MPRYRMNRVLRRKGFMRFQYRSAEHAARTAGEMLNVDYVAYGNVGRKGDSYVLKCFLMNTATKAVEKRADISSAVDIDEFLNTAPQKAVAELLGIETAEIQPPSRERAPETVPAEKPRPRRRETVRPAPRPEPRVKPVPPVKQPGIVKASPEKAPEPKPRITRLTPPVEMEARATPVSRADFIPDRLGYMWRRVRKLDMEKSGGAPIDADYPYYRMRSTRNVLKTGWDLYDRYRVYLNLGMADLRVHSNEGETTSFDASFGIGLLFEARLCRVDIFGGQADLNYSQNFLSFEADNGDTVRARRDATRTGGDVSIDWKEYQSSLYLTSYMPQTRLIWGARYTKVDAEETRSYTDGTEYKGDYDVQDPLGAFVKLEYDVSDNVTLGLNADVVTQTAFEMSLFYAF
ncbi:MAG: hypothetical protein R6V03_00025 [Kiritimatiellia bacterium]